MPTFHHPARVDVIEGAGGPEGAALAGLGAGVAIVAIVTVVSWITAHVLLIVAILAASVVLGASAAVLAVRYLYRHHTVLVWRTAPPPPVTLVASRPAIEGVPARPVSQAERPAIQGKRPETVPGGLFGLDQARAQAEARREGRQS